MFGRRKDVSLPDKWLYHPGGAGVTELLTATMYDSLKMDQSHLLRKSVLLFLKVKILPLMAVVLGFLTAS